MKKLNIGDFVLFQRRHRPRDSQFGFINAIVLIENELTGYEIGTVENDFIFRFSDEVRLATEKQLVNELNEWLRDELVANFKETV